MQRIVGPSGGLLHLMDWPINPYKFSTPKEGMEPHELTDSEKELLNVVGAFPDASLKELVNRTPYAWESTIVKKLEKLKKQHILFGPSYYLDCGKLCRNMLYRVFCIIETQQKLNKVISYLKIIKSLGWVFPVLSPQKNMLIAGFYSSDNTEMASLIQLLKDHAIISDATLRISHNKRIMVNPNLYGNPIPPLDTLLAPSHIPDTSYGRKTTAWSECDIAILPYFITGSKSTKLIDILKKEKKGRKTLTYNQLQYSHKKMVHNKLINKEYAVSPYPYNQCVHFLLFITAQDTSMTQRIIYNFGKGERIYKEYLSFEKWGMIECISHPVFLNKLLNELDKIDEIKKKEFYHVRSLLPEKYWLTHTPDFTCYNIDTQRLEYPYHIYRKKIKEKLKNEQ